MQGVIDDLKKCYQTIRYGADIEPLARCFAMDYVAYMIGSGFSAMTGTRNNNYTDADNMADRAIANLKKFGYDKEGTRRQVGSWVGKIKDWMREAGHL